MQHLPTSSTQREHRNELNYRFGHRLIDMAPDHRPAVRLRQELARDRAAGLTFDQVWLDDVDYVIDTYRRRGRLSATDADQWRTAFLATESAWRSAYNRTEPYVSSLQVDLLAA